ncbi:hypothetical protein E3P89_00885 [Wallemia ichthyophaga]|uniref:Acyl-CoA desaturase n=1 Tax=Wallemia ichthyophaga TaxID=245174 RepID=A0A4T0GJV0_WALIC|nr:hypothetical protein E3P98_01318 [Wallemia ichthyophaga]TIB01511.1 hypothetical protein E3P95_01320 [Wallemia ichthyophaga]TIB02470.1 hypothetical protein E3P94_01452 [Wallemia ichthyophaga]TIB14616.1 hypothetical protein E3P90_01180 [Wallemia ichthyophaga]TIB16552.1 hypothetical protein E3P93_00931 [Wallemia ichthyophaga]
MSSTATTPQRVPKDEIWWSNAIFFTGMHVAAVYGAVVLSPWRDLHTYTLALCVASWQLASFGITLGYHRLWSHKAYTARLPLRTALAFMGSLGFQGSIKWWVVRHRLHHRFTDDPVHDPYSAQLGLFWSHCGWIYYKRAYPRMKMIDKGDLESDPVVRFQHRHYIPIALTAGLLLPAVAARQWGDALGGFVWGGLVARLLIWHCTFMINSLAHYIGDQPYSEENSSRGTLFIALCTSGEGNHNFHHAFPHDYRNGPARGDWDPSAWVLHLLHALTNQIPYLHRITDTDYLKAKAGMLSLEASRLHERIPKENVARSESELPVWGAAEVRERARASGEHAGQGGKQLLLLIDGFIVDATPYADSHPGGRGILTEWSISATGKRIKDSTRAFDGLVNKHSKGAKETMRVYRVARYEE